MSAGWIAGDVRARGLVTAEAIDVASKVAETPGLAPAVAILGQTRWIRDTRLCDECRSSPAGGLRDPHLAVAGSCGLAPFRGC